MTPTRLAEWLGADKLGPEESGPEKFAQDRQVPEPLSDVDQAANTIEGEIRNLVRHDAVVLQQQPSEAGPADYPVTADMNSLIRRVAGASMDEINRVIQELESVRNTLRTEGRRVSQGVAGYCSLNHAAMTAMKVITDSIKQWKDAQDKLRVR